MCTVYRSREATESEIFLIVPSDRKPVEKIERKEPFSPESRSLCRRDGGIFVGTNYKKDLERREREKCGVRREFDARLAR